VLIVDPEPDLRELAREALAELGHAPVLPGEPGAEAVDAALLASSPEMATVVTRLRLRNPALKVIGIGDGPAGEAIRSLAPAAYLVRPYSLDALDRALSVALAVPAAK
jgi:CheY-like chemotaxis protein